MNQLLIQVEPNSFRIDGDIDTGVRIFLGSWNGPTLYERFLMRFAPREYAERMAAEMEEASGMKVIRMKRGEAG